MAIGAALALRGSGRMAVSILGDGDFSMSMNALWTAAHYAIPVLIIIANNGSYLNDEIHQHAVAETRRRPTENRWIVNKRWIRARTSPQSRARKASSATVRSNAAPI